MTSWWPYWCINQWNPGGAELFWVLLCKNFLLFQEICIAANHVTENNPFNGHLPTSLNCCYTDQRPSSYQACRFPLKLNMMLGFNAKPQHNLNYLLGVSSVSVVVTGVKVIESSFSFCTSQMGSLNCYYSSKQDSQHHRRTNTGTDSNVGYMQP